MVNILGILCYNTCIMVYIWIKYLNVYRCTVHLENVNSLLPTNALFINPLKPNDLKRRRTAQLTSRCCILYIYSTNIPTEYFKHAV